MYHKRYLQYFLYFYGFDIYGFYYLCTFFLNVMVANVFPTASLYKYLLVFCNFKKKIDNDKSSIVMS